MFELAPAFELTRPAAEPARRPDARPSAPRDYHAAHLLLNVVHDLARRLKRDPAAWAWGESGGEFWAWVEFSTGHAMDVTAMTGPWPMDYDFPDDFVTTDDIPGLLRSVATAYERDHR